MEEEQTNEMTSFPILCDRYDETGSDRFPPPGVIWGLLVLAVKRWEREASRIFAACERCMRVEILPVHFMIKRMFMSIQPLIYFGLTSAVFSLHRTYQR